MSRVVYENQFDHMMPMDRCAECGKEFFRRCRREEWGYRVRSSTGLKLFCSGQCADAYEHRIFMENVQEVTKNQGIRRLQAVTNKEHSDGTGYENGRRKGRAHGPEPDDEQMERT